MRSYLPAINNKIRSVRSTKLSKPNLLVGWILFILFFPKVILAEGSKELNAHGGNRAYLLSGTTANSSFPFPTLGTMKVYVKAGEIILVGSSAQGIGTGTINLRAPDGSTYTSGSSTTVGFIPDRASELAGPLPHSGGFTPYTRNVTADQEGVWEIDMISPGTGSDVESSPTPIAANGNWAQPTGQYIAAFDVSVRNPTNTGFISGRVFTNIFSGLISNFNTGFNGIFYVLTKDGYQYTVDNNGQAGNGFSFFVNNKGFRNGAGAASYLSINSTNNTNVQDPRAPDSQTDITHKLFFTTPANDMPATAKVPGGGSTWLVNPPFVPTLTATGFTGTEGTQGKAGTSPLGGTINFTATSNGSYAIVIDANKNGIFTDPIDRKLTGLSVIGANSISWDGLDGLSNKLPASTVSYKARITVSLNSAEVHFPFFDVERNVNGVKLTRTSGTDSPDNTVYWDDSQITVVGTPSSPVRNLTGINSLANGHRWGSPTTEPNNELDFGNNKGIDTWAYVSSPPLNASIELVVQQADLEVVSLKADVNEGCVGQKITYTAVVRNNGPSDAVGSKFSFAYPAELSNITVSSAATTGSSTLGAETSTTNLYSVILNMPNGAVRTFTITGTVKGAPTGSLDVTAAILRPADVTDPDATDPNTAVPTDALAECNASGTGCNNIKTNSANFLALPNAGVDQIVEKNTIGTLKANMSGKWSQLGITPTLANINAPASATTTVSGLTTVGQYQFVFTNANGCADTTAIIVTSSTVDPPKIITPNGDDKNDHLTIPDIEFYPGSKVSVYNRWGNEVFHSENYKNDWSGDGLADGTYYYLVNRKEKDGSYKVFKGWVYLKRSK